MPSPRVARGAQIAAELRAAGVNATHDPQQLAGQLPAVLVQAPRLDYVGAAMAGPTASWRLLLVASTPNALDAWTQLDELLEAVEAAIPVELAEPTAYPPDPASPPLPAFALTYTETVES